MWPPPCGWSHFQDADADFESSVPINKLTALSEHEAIASQGLRGDLIKGAVKQYKLQRHPVDVTMLISPSDSLFCKCPKQVMFR